MASLKGFSAEFSDSSNTLPDLVTTTVTTAVTNTITELYPNNYPADINKCWVQTPTTGQALMLDFFNFDVSTIIQYNKQCI